MKKLLTTVAALILTLVASKTAMAASATYVVSMDGNQEVDDDGNPDQGDLDGSAMGTIFLDDATGEISWNLNFSDIADPSAMHIHGPDGSAGSSAGVFIGLGVDTSGGAGTLINSIVHDDLGQISSVLADPTDFYLNIHNADFGAGAVRGQLGTLIPEPGSLALLGLGGFGLLAWRRRRA